MQPPKIIFASLRAEVAQLVEQWTENPRVVSSILTLGTTHQSRRSSVVEQGFRKAQAVGSNPSVGSTPHELIERG